MSTPAAAPQSSQQQHSSTSTSNRSKNSADSSNTPHRPVAVSNASLDTILNFDHHQHQYHNNRLLSEDMIESIHEQHNDSFPHDAAAASRNRRISPFHNNRNSSSTPGEPTPVSPVLASSSFSDPSVAAFPSGSTAEALLGVPSSTNAGGAVPEFLYQLTKMLTDNNRDVIEWSDAMIKVHNPLKLESHVLHKYFRHSKFSSFQRQLNYFGFRKLAGKGKMAPCSYVNESAGKNIASLLHIKRKSGATNPTTGKDKAVKAAMKKEAGTSPPAGPSEPSTPPRSPSTTNVEPNSRHVRQASAPGTVRTAPSTNNAAPPSRMGVMSQPPRPPTAPPNTTTISKRTGYSAQLALARSAVGRGVRHSFSAANTLPSVPMARVPDPLDPNTAAASTDNHTQETNLSQLEHAYRNSLNDLDLTSSQPQPRSTHYPLQDAAPSGPQNASFPNSSTIIRQTPSPGHDSSQQPTQPQQEENGMDDFMGGFLSRNSSLVDLAMLPEQDIIMPSNNTDSSELGNPDDLVFGTSNKDTDCWGFVDFPYPELDPSRKGI